METKKMWKVLSAIRYRISDNFSAFTPPLSLCATLDVIDITLPIAVYNIPAEREREVCFSEYLY